MGKRLSQIEKEYESLPDSKLEAIAQNLKPSYEQRQTNMALALYGGFLGIPLTLTLISGGLRFFGCNEIAQAVEETACSGATIYSSMLPFVAVAAHSLTGKRAEQDKQYTIAKDILNKRLEIASPEYAI
jgi:hypothetical protein